MKIPILHLSDGIHQFEQTVNSESLNFSRSDVYPYPLEIKAEVNKFEKNILCKVYLKTVAHYTCDRCLEPFDNPLEFNFELLFRSGKDKLETDEEDVVNLPAETVEVDLTERVIENLILEIPMKAICKDDCKGICSGCGANLNLEACQCSEKPTDPRWEKLRDLLE
jgi:uncharacterized protein